MTKPWISTLYEVSRKPRAGMAAFQKVAARWSSHDQPELQQHRRREKPREYLIVRKTPTQYAGDGGFVRSQVLSPEYTI